MVELFETVFWETANASIALILPILCLYILFDILHGILWK